MIPRSEAAITPVETPTVGKEGVGPVLRTFNRVISRKKTREPQKNVRRTPFCEETSHVFFRENNNSKHFCIRESRKMTQNCILAFANRKSG